MHLTCCYVRVGEPDRGVPLAFGVFVPDGPNDEGGPTSPCVPSGSNELMYALPHQLGSPLVSLFGSR